MILIGIGSNLAAAGRASPRDTAAATLEMLPVCGASVVARSAWYESEPVPRSDQPWYVNAVATLATRLAPMPLLEALLTLETRFGRRREGLNAARTLDLDLLDYDGAILDSPRLTLPHPRLHERRFVLAPLAEVVPGWRHPRLGAPVAALLDALSAGQPVRRLGNAPR